MSGTRERYLQFGVGSVDQSIAEDGVPVLNVRAAGKSQPHVSLPHGVCLGGLPPLAPHNSLESKGAAVEFLGSAEPGFLGWGAAEQEELMGGVHELQLLPGEREEQRQSQRGERTDRQTEIMHGSPVPCPSRPCFGPPELARRARGIPLSLVPRPTDHDKYPPSYIPYAASHNSQAADPIPKAASYIPDPYITRLVPLHPLSCILHPTARTPYPMSRISYPTSHTPHPTSRIAYPMSCIPYPMSQPHILHPTIPYPASCFLYPTSHLL